MPELFVSVAEPSGDRLAAELLSELPDRASWVVRGVCGPRLRAAGVEMVVPMEELSVMGVGEVLRHVVRLRAVRERLRAALLEARPKEVVLFVDAPDLHLGLAKSARASGRKTVGYVSPQVWAWRRGRTSSVVESYDTLLCLFDFEPELYPDGYDVRFVGHPVLDRVPARRPIEEDLFALMPGSRAQEIERHLAPFLEAARLVLERKPEARFLLVDPSGHTTATLLPERVSRALDLDAVAGARAALTKSGTVTLELAVMGVPQVVAHRVHPMTYGLGRLLVDGVSHISLPNILARREVVPEFVQHFTPSQLADALLSLPLEQPVSLGALGSTGAARRAALEVASAVAEPVS